MYSYIINIPIYLFNLLFITIQRGQKKKKTGAQCSRRQAQHEERVTNLQFNLFHSKYYTLIIGILGTGSHKMHHDSLWEGTAQKKEDEKSKSCV